MSSASSPESSSSAEECPMKCRMCGLVQSSRSRRRGAGGAPLDVPLHRKVRGHDRVDDAPHLLLGAQPLVARAASDNHEDPQRARIPPRHRLLGRPQRRGRDSSRPRARDVSEDIARVAAQEFPWEAPEFAIVNLQDEAHILAERARPSTPSRRPERAGRRDAHQCGRWRRRLDASCAAKLVDDLGRAGDTSLAATRRGWSGTSRLGHGRLTRRRYSASG